MKLQQHLMYFFIHLFDQQFWELDQTPPELLETIAILPAGTMIDVGCGVGKHAINLAKLGWHVTALDFSNVAISKAKQTAEKEGLSDKTNFLVQDITRIPEAKLAPMDFGYDLGCFYFTNEKDQLDTVAGIASVLKPGATFLLLEFLPHIRKRPLRGTIHVGTSPERIEEIFSPFFTIEKTKVAHTWKFPSQYYWLKRKED